MSAFAAAIQEQQIILISDGLAYGDGRTIDENVRKVFKVSSFSGFVWLGAAIQAGAMMHKAVMHSAIREPRAMIEFISNTAQKHVFINGIEESLNVLPLYVLTVGYSDKGIEAYQIFTGKQKSFEAHRLAFNPGDTACVSWGRSGPETSFGTLLCQKYYPQLKPDINQATRRAFCEMIRDYGNQGDPVGGAVFIETLVNPKFSIHNN